MSRGTGSDAIPPIDPPGRAERYTNPQFGPQNQLDASARRIEQGISQGSGTQALHEELAQIRQAAMQNGSFDLAQYKANVGEIEKKLHADGFLPRLHLSVDEQGHDVASRMGPQRSDLPTGPSDRSPGPSDGPAERTHGHGRRGHGHGRRGHHGRGHHGRHHRGGSAEQPQSQGDNSDDSQAAPQTGEINERDMRPGDRQPDPRGVDRSDPNKDRSQRSGDPQIWGAPTISAQQIDKVLRDNHSPAAGLGNYLYDQAVAHHINPAFALAMYGQESTYGTKGAAVRNNSFGNIRGAGGHGFKHYDNIKDGIDHWMTLLSSDGYRGKNLAQIIHRYAPGSDGNNPRGYMAYVQNNMSKWARSGDDQGDNRRYA